MGERATVEYSAVILCEDIRQEVDGKRTLLGVYTSNAIIVPYLPMQMTFALFAAGIVRRAGSFQPSLVIEDYDYNTIYRDEASSPILLRAGKFTQSLQASIELSRAGPVRFTILHGDERVASVSHAIAVGEPPTRDVA